MEQLKSLGIKPPGASQLYSFDFTKLCARDGSMLQAGATVTAFPSDLVISEVSVIGTTVTFRLAGGTFGLTYTLNANAPALKPGEANPIIYSPSATLLVYASS